MLSADALLGLLQWALIGVGIGICLLTLSSLIIETPQGNYVYSYPDGRTVEAAYAGETSVLQSLGGIFYGLAAGLLSITFGAILFCLRRIGGFMGDMRDEMRQLQHREVADGGQRQ